MYAPAVQRPPCDPVWTADELRALGVVAGLVRTCRAIEMDAARQTVQFEGVDPATFGPLLLAIERLQGRRRT